MDNTGTAYTNNYLLGAWESKPMLETRKDISSHNSTNDQYEICVNEQNNTDDKVWNWISQIVDQGCVWIAPCQATKSNDWERCLGQGGEQTKHAPSTRTSELLPINTDTFARHNQHEINHESSTWTIWRSNEKDRYSDNYMYGIQR